MAQGPRPDDDERDLLRIVVGLLSDVRLELRDINRKIKQPVEHSSPDIRVKESKKA